MLSSFLRPVFVTQRFFKGAAVVLTQEQQENLFSSFDLILCTEVDLYENSLRVKVLDLLIVSILKYGCSTSVSVTSLILVARVKVRISG